MKVYFEVWYQGKWYAGNYILAHSIMMAISRLMYYYGYRREHLRGFRECHEDGV